MTCRKFDDGIGFDDAADLRGQRLHGLHPRVPLPHADAATVRYLQMN